MRKTLSLILTLVTLFSLVLPVNAAEDTFELTVKPSETSFQLPSDWKVSYEDNCVVFSPLTGKSVYMAYSFHDLTKYNTDTASYTSDTCNDSFSKADIADVFDAKTKDVSFVNLGGTEYFQIQTTQTSGFLFFKKTKTTTRLLHISNGQAHLFCFDDDSDHELFGEFQTIIASAKFSGTSGANENPAIPETTEASIAEIDYMGGTYRGELQNGKPHGEGTLTLSEGTYTGSFVNGYPQGTGVFTFSNGKTVDGDNWSYGSIYVDLLMADYSGMLLDGKPAGYGTLYFDYGAQYTGTFRNEYPYGQGEYIASTSKKTSGHWEWVEDVYDSWVPDRQGADMYYTGMTCNNKFCGYGSLTFLSGGQFLGEFAKGDPNGWGIYAYRSPSTESDRYMYGTAWTTVHGEYRLEHTYYGLKLEDKWQGFGIGIKKSGYAYCGEILDDYRDGHGELYTPKDKLEEWGIYRRGKIKEKYSLS